MSKSRLQDLLRLQHIPRWCTIRVGRDQSVAEHSFNVAAIALDICDHLGMGAALEDDCLRFAITHDGPECFTGDLPSPLKHELSPAEMEDILFRACPWYEREMALPDDRAIRIVKIADLLEAWMFASTFSYDAGAAQYVRDGLDSTVKEAVARYGWTTLPEYLSHLMYQTSYPVGGLDIAGAPGPVKVERSPAMSQPDRLDSVEVEASPERESQSAARSEGPRPRPRPETGTSQWNSGSDS